MKSKFTWSLIGLSLFFGMVGCSSSKQETTEIPVITIDPGKQMTAEEMAQHFTNDRLVILRGAMLGRIDRIIDWGDRFVILDGKEQQAVIFDTTGNCIVQIKRQGKGPGEYVQVGDCAVDPSTDELVLLADQPGKLLWFDRDGKYLREKRVSACMTELAGLGETWYGQNCSVSGNTLTRITPSGEETPMLPHLPDLPNAYAGKSLHSNGKTVLLSRPFDYTIYALNGESGEFEPLCKLDWGNEGLSEAQLTESLDMDQIRRDQKTYHVAPVGQVGSYLFVRGISFHVSFGLMINPQTGEMKSLGWTTPFRSLDCSIGGYNLVENQDRYIAHEILPIILESWSETLKSKGERNAQLDSVMAANVDMNSVLLFQDVK